MNTFWFRPSSLVLLATLILAAAAAPAAESPKVPPAGDRPRGNEKSPERGALDEKQRTLLRESMQSHRDELRQLDEKMQAAQKQLMEAVLADKQDSAVIREKAEALAKVQVEQTVLRAKIVAVVVPTLTPEQREQIENSPMAMMLLGGGVSNAMARDKMRGEMGRGARDPGNRPPRDRNR